MLDRMPSAKITTATIVGAIVTGIVAAINSLDTGIMITPEQAAVVTGLIMIVAAWFKRETNPSPSAIETIRRDH